MSNVVRPMESDEFDELLIAMLHPKSRIELRYMLVTLFCLLYAQYPKAVLALRTESLRIAEGSWQFRPSKIWLDVPDPMGALLTDWYASRREQSIMEPTGSSPYMFPGRRSTAQVSTASFNDWFKKRGCDPRRLFASGFANLCRHGLEFASVARDAYGVNSATAVRYLAEFHPAKAAIAAREVRASTAKRKRSRSP